MAFCGFYCAVLRFQNCAGVDGFWFLLCSTLPHKQYFAHNKVCCGKQALVHSINIIQVLFSHFVQEYGRICTYQGCWKIARTSGTSGNLLFQLTIQGSAPWVAPKMGLSNPQRCVSLWGCTAAKHLCPLCSIRGATHMGRKKVQKRQLY